MRAAVTASPLRPFLLSIVALTLFAALAAAFLAPVLFTDRALLPTGLLMQMSPWAEESPTGVRSSRSGDAAPPPNAEPWNPILWDAIAQFYPWRAFAAHWMRRGTIPFWDPHQFCGTPFLANSQSAVLYPLHLLLLDLPAGLPVARAMALLAAIHLTLAGFLTFLWLRALRLSPFAAVLGGITFMLSGFSVTWLELPSFLTVACWLPLLFMTTHRLTESPTAARAAALAAAVGMTLLGGHLQIAFYCLLGAGLYALWVLVVRYCGSVSRTPKTEHRTPNTSRSVLPLVLCGTVALTLGVMIAAPQLLPSVELSRLSHRVSSASAAGYAAYVGGAMPAGQLIRLFLPDFYGNPTRGDYIAGSPADYTEFAGYIGGLGILLALAALLAWRRRPRETIFAAGLVALSLLLAMGTPLNWLFYFLIPGFSQSGSPARVLVLFCFAGAWLVGLGTEALFETGGIGQPTWLPLAALGMWLALLGVSLLAARAFVEGRGADFAPVLARSGPALRLAVVSVALAAGLPLGLRRLSLLSPATAGLVGRAVLAALLLGDLWLFGAGFNPTGPLAQVYPKTPLIDALQAGPASGSGRVLSVNRRWNLYGHPHALLPPNSALAVGLIDPQGYDSLFLGRYKGLANLVQDAETAPPENGNMLFFFNLNSPLLPLLAADRIVTSTGGSGSGKGEGMAVPGVSPDQPRGWPTLYENAGLRVHRYRAALPRAFVARDWRAVPEEGMPAELQKLAMTGALSTTALVSDRPSASRGSEPASTPPPPRDSRLSAVEAGPNAVTVTLPKTDHPAPNTANGMLVLLDNHYPGWRSTDLPSGRQLPIHRVNLTFRGVELSGGVSSVRFQYQPGSFRLGLYLAVLAVGVAAGCWVCGSKPQNRTRNTGIGAISSAP